jgi:hypothetical protein
MPGIATTAGLQHVLDPRFREIVFQAFEEEPDRIGEFYSQVTPTQETERWSEIANIGDVPEFTGQLEYEAPEQGFESTATQREYAKAMQIQRRLWELEQFGVIEKFFSNLGRSSRRTQQKQAARLFNNAFSLDEFFGTSGEGVPLVSSSHTTTVDGVSTATGFDNKTTSALSPTSLAAAYIKFRKFRDLSGEQLDLRPTHLLVPVDLRFRAEEILQTVNGLDSAEGNINVLRDKVQLKDWFRLTDNNNWFLYNEPLLKENTFWLAKVKPEFARMEAFDQIVAKYRVYFMHTVGRRDWRQILGAEVS